MVFVFQTQLGDLGSGCSLYFNLVAIGLRIFAAMMALWL